MQHNKADLVNKNSLPLLSIVIPTYNESENIIRLIDSIKYYIGSTIPAEIIVVDDNSPDGTGKLVDEYITYYGKINGKLADTKIIHRIKREGLIQAILDGVSSSQGQTVLVMDADFSHPPETIPKIIKLLEKNKNCVVVASRYVKGGSIRGWTLKRRLLSLGANSIARYSLKIGMVKDPMSGFFAFPRRVVENIKFDTKGYKILLELLVKDRRLKVIEIPYTFTDRKYGKSKLNKSVILDYVKSIWQLYRYGKKKSNSANSEKNSVKFISKAGRFFTVGATGLLVNYLVSFLLSSGTLASLWYMHATIIGIVASITSNFILNKLWTFNDRNFSLYHVIKQYSSFFLICSLGGLVQLGLVYALVESGLSYGISLLIAVIAASISNFILNKKITFKEKIWG